MNWTFFRRHNEKTPVAAGVSTNKEGNTVQRVSTNGTADNLFSTITNGHERARAERWLEDRIKRGRKEPFSEVVLLTPELAALLLSRNPENRVVNPYQVAATSTDIQAGRFQLNGETVVVSKCGLLNDGQHRCYSVIETGIAVQTFIAFGVERDTRTTVDGGRARTPGDYLSMSGVPSGNHVAAVSRMVLEIERNGKLVTGMTGKPTKQEVLERGLSDRLIGHAIRAAHKPGVNKLASVSLLATAWYFFAKKDRVAADAFIAKLIKGADLPERSPIWTAREKLLRKDNRLNQNEKLKTIIMAWNAWRSGARTRKTLTHAVKKGEQLPEVRP